MLRPTADLVYYNLAYQEPIKSFEPYTKLNKKITKK